MNWIKVKVHEHPGNVPYDKKLLMSNGSWVQYVEGHGWDKDEYYFHNGTGKVEGVTHFMVFPPPPKK